MTLNSTIRRVTDRIIERSSATRSAYLVRMAESTSKGPARAHLSCSGQAHAFAGAGEDHAALVAQGSGNLGIVTAYHDLPSAHRPF